jgi:hypothetical protein
MINANGKKETEEMSKTTLVFFGIEIVAWQAARLFATMSHKGVIPSYPSQGSDLKYTYNTLFTKERAFLPQKGNKLQPTTSTASGLRPSQFQIAIPAHLGFRRTMSAYYDPSTNQICYPKSAGGVVGRVVDGADGLVKLKGKRIRGEILEISDAPENFSRDERGEVSYTAAFLFDPSVVSCDVVAFIGAGWCVLLA